jgi:Bifunctional DNA primase/polymerase, N-terminal
MSVWSAFAAECVMWARRYAAQGLPVFPINPVNKVPRVEWKTKASTDPQQIRDWWQENPFSMIGMPTGQRSGYVVLDVDRKNDKDGFATLIASGWNISRDAVEVRTPSGGAHFYFRLKPGQIIKSNAGQIGAGCDIRGEGGLVILPPSRRRIDGPDYHFVEGQGPDGCGLSAGCLSW